MTTSECQCYQCEMERTFQSNKPHIRTRMILCEHCGNKRCPHATDHRNECTNSNEPGQTGSNYA